MRTMRIWVLLIGAGLAALAPGAALAGGGGGGGGPCAGFADGTTLVMMDSCFNGVAHFVDARTTLVVRNKGAMPHSFTAVDGSFDTGLLASGETAEIRLGADGIVRAFCTLHGTAAGNGMAGILVVGNPSPEAMGTVGLAQGLQDALAEHDQALLEETKAQSRSLAALEAEMAAIKQAVEGVAADTRPAQATGLGVLGIMLGGAALAAVLNRRRSGESSGG